VCRTYGIKTARALFGLDYGTGEATHRCYLPAVTAVQAGEKKDENLVKESLKVSKL